MINNLLEKKFEGFSNLSDEECGKIIELYLLEGLESDTLLEHEMMTKFIVCPYPGRELIRKIFNTAIKKNRQKIADFTVGEWLGKYIKRYENIERTPDTFFEFVNSSSEIKALPKKDKVRLMRIFRMYDYLLVEPISELDDIRMNILKFPMYLNEENPEMPVIQKTQSEENYRKEIPKRVISAFISSAMQQYPNLGEQLVTSSPIKLKIFPSPVRPSIKNWIEDYRFTMGAQKHGMMERGNYLFHSENTKKLTSGERKKLAEVLHSLDEDVALKIDPERQEIVFEVIEEKTPVEKLEKMPNFPASTSPRRGEQPASPAGGFPMPNQYQSLNNKIQNQQIIPPQQDIAKATTNNFSAQSGPAAGWQNQSEKKPDLPQNSANFNSPSLPNIPPAPMSQGRYERGNQITTPSAVNFSSPHTFPSGRENEPLIHQSMRPSESPKPLNQPEFREPAANSRAGQPWTPSGQNSEPKISGNVVDLKG
jgi:hypothetical protein